MEGNIVANMVPQTPRLLRISYQDYLMLSLSRRDRPYYFVAGLPHMILIELRQALVSYQAYHMLWLTLAGARNRRSRPCEHLGACELLDERQPRFAHTHTSYQYDSAKSHHRRVQLGLCT